MVQTMISVVYDGTSKLPNLYALEPWSALLEKVPLNIFFDMILLNATREPKQPYDALQPSISGNLQKT